MGGGGRDRGKQDAGIGMEWGGGATCMVDKPAPGVLKQGLPCQVQGQALEGPVPLTPLGDVLLEGMQG